MTPRYLHLTTALGPYLLAADGAAITGLWREGQAHGPGSAAWESTEVERDEDPVLERAARQVEAYLDGRATSFSLPLAPRGTAFQQRVWARLREIPFGQTTTYGALARDLGLPRGAQAVGAAVGRNPISIIIPCHRVLGRDGRLTGYAAGPATKTALLRLEGVPGI